MLELHLLLLIHLFYLISFLLAAPPLLLQSPVQLVTSPALVWFPATLVPETTTSLNMAAPTASPAPSMAPPLLPVQPPFSTAPVSVTVQDKTRFFFLIYVHGKPTQTSTVHNRALFLWLLRKIFGFYF